MFSVINIVIWRHLPVSLYINPFLPKEPFLYPLKTSENRKVFWCFQEVEKGGIGNEWVKSEHSKILRENPVKHLRWIFLWKNVNGFQLVILAKKLHFKCLIGFWIRPWDGIEKFYILIVFTEFCWKSDFPQKYVTKAWRWIAAFKNSRSNWITCRKVNTTTFSLW